MGDWMANVAFPISLDVLRELLNLPETAAVIAVETDWRNAMDGVCVVYVATPDFPPRGEDYFGAGPIFRSLPDGGIEFLGWGTEEETISEAHDAPEEG
jgi:hypothetical protein